MPERILYPDWPGPGLQPFRGSSLPDGSTDVLLRSKDLIVPKLGEVSVICWRSAPYPQQSSEPITLLEEGEPLREPMIFFGKTDEGKKYWRNMALGVSGGGHAEDFFNVFRLAVNLRAPISDDLYCRLYIQRIKTALVSSMRPRTDPESQQPYLSGRVWKLHGFDQKPAQLYVPPDPKVLNELRISFHTELASIEDFR